jgi:hypothetical protein
MSARIDRKKIDKLCLSAEKLGLRVVHIHADVKTPGEGTRIKIEFQDRGKK